MVEGFTRQAGEEVERAEVTREVRVSGDVGRAGRVGAYHHPGTHRGGNGSRRENVRLSNRVATTVPERVVQGPDGHGGFARGQGDLALNLPKRQETGREAVEEAKVEEGWAGRRRWSGVGRGAGEPGEEVGGEALRRSGVVEGGREAIDAGTRDRHIVAETHGVSSVEVDVGGEDRVVEEA